MPPPKSPLEKPSSAQYRRPNSSRQSSSDQSATKTSRYGVNLQQSTSDKHRESATETVVGRLAQSPGSANKEGPSFEGGISESLRRKSMDRSDTGRKDLRQKESEEGLARQHEARRGVSSPETLTSAEEVERLRAAMNAQIQLTQHREKLASQLEEKGPRTSVGGAVPGRKTRVSPIHEEATSPSLEEAFASPLPIGLETTSTESAKTVRGGFTPGIMTARTPSYPFPAMRTPGGFTGHRPFTALSPTVNPANFAGGMFDGGPYDQVMSGSVTPASTLRFQPHSTYQPADDSMFETPNLYDLSLMLGSEPGLDAWWTTVAQIMRTVYHAHRVTLSVPADSTDVENVPWGQKATFNVQEEDELSLTYLPRGSSIVPSSVDTNETSNSDEPNTTDEYLSMATSMSHIPRPGLLSRHSFTAYEDTKRDPTISSQPPRPSGAAVARPVTMTRAKSYLSSRSELPPRTATLQNAQLSLQSLQDHVAFEDAKTSAAWENPQAASRQVRGQVFSVLQALEYEAEPLIDNKGVLRVLERGKVIALTRDYPYVDSHGEEVSGSNKRSHHISKSKESTGEKVVKPKPPDVTSRISTFFGGRPRRSSRNSRGQAGEKGKFIIGSVKASDDVDDFPLPTKYEEYEQSPPSPWSQSPAPSPAVRVETSENPFFTTTAVDEETFNPRPTTQDYSDMPQPETIGVDRSWTVLHVPLVHPLLSKPVQTFRLDAAAMESKTGRGKATVESSTKEQGQSKMNEESKEKPTPIAILSILTPVIPYPSNLRHSLSHLAPHLATSFSLCRHYSHLETEIAGLSRKRPQLSGFGPVVPGGRPVGDPANPEHILYSPADEAGPLQSTGGSITSPSDYSNISRSTAGSPAGTPGWDPASVGLSMDKRSSGGSPNYAPGEGYFSSRSRPVLGRADTGSASSITGARRTSKETSPQESRSQKPARLLEEGVLDPEKQVFDQGREALRLESDQDDPRSSNTTPKQEPRPHRASKDVAFESSDVKESSSPRRSFETNWSPRRQALRTASEHGQGPAKSDRVHTQLHSYGADFGATFQSLPTTSSNPTKAGTVTKAHSRANSLSVPADYMPPPSDRVKGIMLDSLPMHIFIALPPTGEIVWVNSRYLTYRGQSVQDLHEDPWASIHDEEREEYLKSWSHAIRTGEQFSMQVRLRRFDGNFRWFYTRAVGLRDIRGVIVQWYGTHMDIHDQHIAEVKAARQEEIEASESKHRQLANLIPQIIFSATEDEGVTFANQQWLSYTGQAFEDALGIGFMDYVHPEDLARCHIPIHVPPTPSYPGPRKSHEPARGLSQPSVVLSNISVAESEAPTESTIKGIYQSLSRTNSSSSESVYEYTTADLSELMKNGVIKVDTDSNGRLSYSTEVRLRAKSGEYRWHLVRCVEVDNLNLGSGDGSWFGACADINDHKLLEMKLKEAMDSKSKFLSNMSHEIRTPLIGISGMTSFLQDTPLNDEQIDYCNTIASSADGLLNIINDILDLAKADAGMMKLSYDWFHTRSLVEEVNEMVSTIAITKHLEVNYVVDVDVPEMIKGDRFRIRQVLLNVIGNAIKFTTVGEVFSRCRVLSNQTATAGANQVMLEFSIIDTGRGFTQEEAEVIFKPFSQIDASSTRTHGGTGLGLVISRQLVELHGGKMEGTAVPGKGSTFTFTATFGLPTNDDHPEPPTPALGKGPSQQSSIMSFTLQDNSILASGHGQKMVAPHPLLPERIFSSPGDSPRTESSADSPTLVSSGSSEPSVRSTRSHGTHRSSGSSLAQSLVHFNEAARAGSADLAGMKLELPERQGSLPHPPLILESISPSATPKPTNLVYNPRRPTPGPSITSDLRLFRPPMYSILLICPQTHSREATTQHIEMTLPKDVPHQITGLSSVGEAREMISGLDPVVFTHIVLNLGSAEDIVALIDQIANSISLFNTSIVVLSDPVQRQEVMKIATVHDYDQLAKDNRVRFIYKPVKPSRFAVIFDPDKERDLSTDRNRFSAQQQVANQRQNYLDIAERLGNKGHKVLLVEDNATNQKVLLKFLSKVGIAVELALDGVECTDKVFAQPHDFYSLILVRPPVLLSFSNLFLFFYMNAALHWL
jgi:PAS domain S-box-containing protein